MPKLNELPSLYTSDKWDMTQWNDYFHTVGTVDILLPWDSATGLVDTTGAVDIGRLTAGFGDIYFEDGKKIKVVTAGGLIRDIDISSLSDSSGPLWTKVTRTFAEFSAAATSNSITLLALDPKEVIHGIIIKPSEAFAGGSITEYKIKIGVTGDLSKYASAFDIAQAVADTTAGTYQMLKWENYGSSTNILATVEADQNLDTATAGSVDIWVLKSTLV